MSRWSGWGRRGSLTAWWILLSLALSACGSTVQAGGGTPTAGIGAPPGSGAPESDLGSPIAQPQATDDGRSAERGAGLPSAAPIETAEDRSAPTSGDSPRLRSVTDGDRPAGTFTVGIRVVGGGEQFSQTFGMGEQSPWGAPREQAEAVIDHINANGGVAGRELVPVFSEWNVTSANPWSVEDQRACSEWTEDEQVVVAVSPPRSYTSTPLAACLDEQGIPFLTEPSFSDEQHLRSLPHLVAPYTINRTRGLRLLVERLAAQGFFAASSAPDLAGGPVLGLVRNDTAPLERSTRQGLDPALDRHGLDIAEEVVMNFPTSTTAIGDYMAQAQNAALRMKARGVTHVLFNMWNPVLFVNAAESQNFFPRYAFATWDYPHYTAQNITAQSAEGAAGMGWSPAWDGGKGNAPEGTPGQAVHELCDRLLTEAGADTDDPGVPNGIAYCELLLLVQFVAERAGESTSASFMDALNGLGDAFHGPFAYATYFDAERHDGPAAVRDIAYAAECGCFRYTSPIIPLR